MRLNAGPKLKISGYRINNAFFADDGLLMATREDVMHELLQITDDWAGETGTTFEPTKCEVLTEAEVQRPFQLHGVNLPACDQYKYLGMFLNNNGIDFQASFQKRIDSMKTMAVFLNARGFNGRGWSQRCVMNAYRTFLRPMLEYGLALAPLSTDMQRRIEKAQEWALRKGYSLARSTSGLALLGTTGLDTMRIRNEKFNARFMLGLHESIDARVPAVVTYWERTNSGTNDARSLPHRFRQHNRVYNKLRLRSSIFHRLTREQVPPQNFMYESHERHSINMDAIEKHRFNTRRETYIEQGNRVAAYTVDPSNWNKMSEAPLVMQNKFLPESDDRRRVMWWMAGRVCNHQPCQHMDCGQALSRKHGIRCSGAEEILRDQFPVQSAACPEDDERCLLDVVLQHVNFGQLTTSQRKECAVKVLAAIDMVVTRCAGRRLSEGDEDEEREAVHEQQQRVIARIMQHIHGQANQQADQHVPEAQQHQQQRLQQPRGRGRGRTINQRRARPQPAQRRRPPGRPPSAATIARRQELAQQRQEQQEQHARAIANAQQEHHHANADQQEQAGLSRGLDPHFDPG